MTLLLRRLAEQMGYINPGNSDEYVGRILNLIRLVSEPVIKGGVYDFGTSDVFARGREAGFEMFLRGYERIPGPTARDHVPAPQTGRLFHAVLTYWRTCGCAETDQPFFTGELDPSTELLTGDDLEGMRNRLSWK